MFDAHHYWVVAVACATLVSGGGISWAEDAPLPDGVRIVWDLSKAYRETTPARERICINGLWHWQPALGEAQEVPAGNWGFFKVPGPWPRAAADGPQTLYAHPNWKSPDFSGVDAAWYQREIAVPAEWAGRRVALTADFLNSFATVYMDGKKVDEMAFPGGEVDITSACKPGGKQVLSILVVAKPLDRLVTSVAQTGQARRVAGTVARRGLTGDVFLASAPARERIHDLRVDTSTRKWEITFQTGLQGLEAGADYTLRAVVRDGNKEAASFTCTPFKAADLKGGRVSFAEKWKPEKLWDLNTPGNQYTVELALLRDTRLLDAYVPVRFGFREFYIQGRDFCLNNSRIWCMVIPFENANRGPYDATYEEARNTFETFRKWGINTVFTHHYSTQPGEHSALDDILRAADDVGILVSLSQPHFLNYDWNAPDAIEKNGYARHAAYYCRVAANHPSVVFYSTSHNALGYAEDMNPDQIGDPTGDRNPAAVTGAQNADKAESIITSIDPSRIVYHHQCGNFNRMYTCNFYLNMTPIQERSDWFEHWATKGVLPAMLVEYGPPLPPSLTLYRGWYEGKRAFLEANVRWELCTAEWASQYVGDEAFKVTDMEKEDLRFETKAFRSGQTWQRFAYPFEFNSQRFDPPNRTLVQAMYLKDNLRAYRTWGLSGPSGWSYDRFFGVRPDFSGQDQRPKSDWEAVQKPGYSIDFTPGRPRVSDWVPNPAGEAFVRNSAPLLAYIAGKADSFTSKDHNFVPGASVEKQIVIINNSRGTADCDVAWSLALPHPISGVRRVSVDTGVIEQIPVSLALPRDTVPGAYVLTMTLKAAGGDTQTDTFDVHVLAPVPAANAGMKMALFDPKGETRKLLDAIGVRCDPVEASADLAGYDILIVGKQALSVEGSAPSIARVPGGLKVIIFEQTAEVLEKRFGFRVQEYGLRNVFRRVPDHPLLAGLAEENLHDWASSSTIYPARLRYEMWRQHGPSVRWAGIQVTRAWRAGTRGNVASALIEKPACGDFLPILDGGFSLQYSPLMVYREGAGMIIFCQMDVSGRTEADPAATRLAANIVRFTETYRPAQGTAGAVLYSGDAAGKRHLEATGFKVVDYAGAKPAAGQVLLVGPSGWEVLAREGEAIKGWLKEGGHVLALGLSSVQANPFLPFTLKTQRAEYINATFQTSPLSSPLAGIGPANVYNRDPRQMELVGGGVERIGDGVLAASADGRVVFCQLVPWTFDWEKYYNQKRTFRQTSFMLTRLLSNMGVSSSTPVVARFGSPARPDGSDSRWLSGLYLDAPVEMDDPYRFFRW